MMRSLSNSSRASSAATRPSRSTVARSQRASTSGSPWVMKIIVVAPRGVDAVQDLHQRRFAGTVLAEERVNLAAADAEIDAAQRLHAGKAFGDAGGLDDEIRALDHLASPGLRLGPKPHFPAGY